MGDEIKITYETLFELLRREKNRAELQALDASFLYDVKNYAENKKSVLAGQRQQLFAGEEMEKTLLQLNNIKKILDELYSRRERKILNLAIIRAKTNALINNSNMLEHEKGLFDSIVNSLKVNRNIVFDELFNNDVKKHEPATADIYIKKEQQAEKEQGEEGILKDSKEQISEMPHLEQKVQQKPEQSISIKFLNPTPKFVGPDLKIYGPYETEDIAELPSKLANVLIEKGKAEMCAVGQSAGI